MKFLLIILLLISGTAFSQTTYYIRADSTRLEKIGGNNELILKNGTRSRAGGYLKNTFDGRTGFFYAVDSAYISGGNLVLVRGGGTQNVTVTVPGGSSTRDTLYVLQSGQSNVNGFNLGIYDSASNSSVLGWNNATHTWGTLRRKNNPMGMATPWINANLIPGYHDSSTNAVFYFAKRLQEKTGKIIKVFNLGWGGDSILSWYGDASVNFSAIKRNVDSSGVPRIDYFLWFQGESDGINGLSDTAYKRRFDSLIAQLDRQTWFKKSTPIFIISATSYWTPQPRILSIQRSIGSGLYDRRFTLIDNQWEHTTDAYHFIDTAMSNVGSKIIQDVYNKNSLVTTLQINATDSTDIKTYAPLVGKGLFVIDSASKKRFEFSGVYFAAINNPYVKLTPPAQQGGTINVTGEIKSNTFLTIGSQVNTAYQLNMVGSFPTGISGMALRNTSSLGWSGTHYFDEAGNFSAVVQWGNSAANTVPPQSANRMQMRTYKAGSYVQLFGGNSLSDFDPEFSVGDDSVFVRGTTLLNVGNVGIGTLTPSATLDLVGTLQYVDGNQSNGFVLTSDASGNATWQAATGGSGTPAGNFGNLQINRNGAFATPGSDSLDFDGGLVVKGSVTSSTLTDGRVLIGGASGLIRDYAALTYDGMNLLNTTTGGASTGITITSTNASSYSSMNFVTTLGGNGFQIGKYGPTGSVANGVFFYNPDNSPTVFTQNNNRILDITGAGNLLLGGTTDPASAYYTIGLHNGGAPTGSITNGVIIYSEDVAASAELKVRDEAGNITVLSPHNFTGIPMGKSEDMAWSYYSERDGKYITVDMLKAIRTIEKLTVRVAELEKRLGVEPTKPTKLVYKGKVKVKQPVPINKNK